MADSAAVASENMISVIADLTKTIEELNTTIASLQADIKILKEDNALLLEENKYLKRKLFGSKSEKISTPDSHFLFKFINIVSSVSCYFRLPHFLIFYCNSSLKNCPI